MGTSASMSSVRSSLWFIPVMCVFVGVLVSIGTIAIDRAGGFELIPRSLTGGPDAAMGILTTIAVSMVSLAALVLTITMVVVQLAMGQFSPRIVQTFLRDKPSQLAIGLFVATFAHAMLAMREVQFDGDGQVPGVAILVGFVLVLTSIAMLVLYVHHIGRSLRVSALIELVGNDTRRLLDHTPIPKTGRNAVVSCEVVFDDLEVPADHLVGEEGRGFTYLLDGLNPERILIAAEAIGIGRVAIEKAVAYANERIVYNRPIGQNQGIAFPLADAYAHLHAATLVVREAGWRYDQGLPCGEHANLAKLLASAAAFDAADRAMQTHGGFGYATEYDIERYWKESRLMKLAPVPRRWSSTT